MAKRKMGRPPLKIDSVEYRKRRDYQKKYYQKNIEKAKEYQRQYNLNHKKKTPKKPTPKDTFKPLPIKDSFNCSDIMNMSPEKMTKTINGIIRGKYIFTGTKE